MTSPRPESPAPASHLLRISLPVILLAFAAYAAALIWTSSQTLLGHRWFSLFDDAMISMRYARNFVYGHGLTWNPGERVEGFTNPGWTLIMALVHLVEPRQYLTSLYIQGLSALSLAGTICLTAIIGMQVGTRSPIAAVMAAVTVAFYFPLNFFSLMGMETGLLSLLIAASTYLILKAETRTAAAWAPWILMGAAVVVRLDSVVPLIALVGAAAIIFPQNRKHYVFAGLSALLISVGGQTIMRLWYYGEWLPNTYYLKMGAVPLETRLGRGLWVTSRFLYNHLWPFYFLVPLILFRYFRDKSGTIAKTKAFVLSPAGLLLALVIGQLAYNTYVGGDVWERQIYANRFLVIIEPAAFILMAQGLVAGLQAIKMMRPILARPWLTSPILGFLMVVQSNTHPGYEFSRDQALLAVPMPHVAEARSFIGVSYSLRQVLPQDATVAVERAGTLPYFMPRHRFYDVLGKTDPVIARTKSRVISEIDTGLKIDTFVPGHTKWDAAHTLGKLKPNLLLLTIGIMAEDYDPWIKRDYAPLNLPGLFGSLFVRKEEEATLGKAIVETYSKTKY